MAEFDLKALCERADVTPRTVHFYVQQGLLPPAGAPGPGARYGEGHVSRLRLIRLLQKQHLPLAEIAKRLRGLTDAQVNALLAETKGRPAPSRGSALEYIRDVLSPAQVSRPLGGGPRANALSAQAAMPAGTATELRTLDYSASVELPGPFRSQWERFTLADGIELHVRRPLPRLQQRKLDRLIGAARDIFQEEPS